MGKKNPTRNLICIITAIAVYVIMNLSGLGGEALGVEGRMYLGGMLMMLIIWLTNCCTGAVSAIILMAVFSFSYPIITGGTAAAGYKALYAGFTQSTFPLLLSAFGITVAVNKTGLGKRMGMMILNVVGAKPKRLMLGILIGFPLMNLFIPSVQSCMLIFMALLAGIFEDYQLDLKSNVAKSIYLTLAFAALPDTMYIQTAGAAAIRCSTVISEVFGEGFTYIQYMINGLPLPILLGTLTYFLVNKLFPHEFDEFPGGDLHIKKRMAEFPKWSYGEKYTGIVLAGALLLWVTGGTLHNIDTGTVALLAFALVLLPKVGTITFQEASSKINWGILCMVGCTSSMATGLVSSGAAKWLVNLVVEKTPVADLPLAVIVIGGLIVVSLVAWGFATRGSVVTALLPLLSTFAIAVAAANGNSFDPRGLATMLFYPMIFSVLVPVHTPFVLQCASAGSFDESEFMKMSVPYILTGLAICVLCFFTYWRWIGLA